jgi:hypothetical protein
MEEAIEARLSQVCRNGDFAGKALMEGSQHLQDQAAASNKGRGRLLLICWGGLRVVVILPEGLQWLRGKSGTEAEGLQVLKLLWLLKAVRVAGQLQCVLSMSPYRAE